MRAQDLSIIEPLSANISCVPSSMSVYVHVFILDCVREMIIFSSNVLAVEPDPPPPPSIFLPQLSRHVVSNMYICHLRHHRANFRWYYSHSKHTLSSSLAIPGISLFPIKGDKNGELSLTTVRTWVKYIVVQIFRVIYRGLINVLPEGVLVPPIHTPIPK